MSDLIKLESPVAPYEEFWVSASAVVLVEPVPHVYGHHAKARILLEGGEKRQCANSVAEIEQLIRQAHTHVREVSE